MKKRRKLGRGVAIVGAGMSNFGVFKEMGSKDLFAEAFREMRSSVDRGLDPRDIDALYLGNFSHDFFTHQAHWAPVIADVTGLVPKPATRIEGAGASSALAFREGVIAIASGLYDMVLVGGVEEMSGSGAEDVVEALAMANTPYARRVGFTLAGVFGAMATAYFARYKANREHLMNVTIKSHNNASLNPKAQCPLTIRAIMNEASENMRKQGFTAPDWTSEKDFLRDLTVNPIVAWPMHLYDCCPVSDGASAMLLVAEEMAEEFTDEPIYVAGIGQGSGRGFHRGSDLTSLEATRYAANEAYAMSGLQPEDIQFCEVHDCFSIAEIVHVEDLGFFRPGEGYKAIADGATALDGPKPVNTSGGLKCKGHPVGATGVSQFYEVWTQLRGRAGKRQIPNRDLRVGGAHSLGGTGGTCAFAILERR